MAVVTNDIYCAEDAQFLIQHSALPAEVRRTYRAERTIRPSELHSSLPIKFWEIEVSDDPEEKWWAGCVHIPPPRGCRWR